MTPAILAGMCRRTIAPPRRRWGSAATRSRRSCATASRHRCCRRPRRRHSSPKSTARWPQVPDAARSKVLGTALHGVIPELVAVVSEDEVCVLRCGEPETMGELTLELTRRPAGVAEGDEALAGAALVAHVAQDLAARGHGDAAVDVDGVGAMIIGAMEDKADVRLHRAAGEEAHRSRNARVIVAQRFEEPR